MTASPAPSPSPKRPFRETAKPGSATAGCLIPVIIGTVVATILAWGVYSFLQQNAAIAGFTEETPRAIEPSRLPEPEADALAARLASFAEGPQGAIRLTAAELNELIAGTPRLEALATMCRVESIDPDGIRAAISFPMRRLGGGRRFLNGTLTAVPRVVEGQFFLEATDIVVPGAEVPVGFLQGYRQNRYLDSLFLRPFEDDEPVAATLATIREASLEPGAVILERSADPAGPPR